MGSADTPPLILDMKNLALITLSLLFSGMALGEEANQQPPLPLASREESLVRLGELMAHAGKISKEAQSQRATAMKAEIEGRGIREGAKENAAKLQSFAKKWEPWNEEFERVAGSVLAKDTKLPDGTGLSEVKASMLSGMVTYTWHGPPDRAKPVLQVKLTCQSMPPEVLGKLPGPLKEIGGTGKGFERQDVAGVFFRDFIVEIKTGRPTDSALSMASKVMDFDALGKLRLTLQGDQPTEPTFSYPPLPVEKLRPLFAQKPRDELQKDFAQAVSKSMTYLAEKTRIGKETSLQHDRMSSGVFRADEKIAQLRAKAASGEEQAGKDLKAAEEERTKLSGELALLHKTLVDEEETLLREVSSGDEPWAASVPGILRPEALNSSLGEISKVIATSANGHLSIQWETDPDSPESGIALDLQIMHQPDGFEERVTLVGKLDDKWPLMANQPSGFVVSYPEFQINFRIPEKAVASGKTALEVAREILDFDALADLPLN